MTRTTPGAGRGGSIFFFNDTATTEIYTLSLHDALPICGGVHGRFPGPHREFAACSADRKSTRLNSSHLGISYAVFCLKKKETVISSRSSRRPSNICGPVISRRPAL